MTIQRDLTLISTTKHNLFYLKLCIIFSFHLYLKPSFQLFPLKPLTCNWELVLHIIVCSSVQFPFAPFQQDVAFACIRDEFILTAKITTIYNHQIYSGLLVEGEQCAGLYCGLVATIMFELLRHMSKEDKVLCTCWLGKIGKTGLRGSHLGHSLPFIDCPSFY